MGRDVSNQSVSCSFVFFLLIATAIKSDRKRISEQSNAFDIERNQRNSTWTSMVTRRPEIGDKIVLNFLKLINLFIKTPIWFLSF